MQALVPTATGRAAYAEALALVRAHEAALFEAFTPGERQELLRLLGKIRAREA